MAKRRTTQDTPSPAGAGAVTAGTAPPDAHRVAPAAERGRLDTWIEEHAGWIIVAAVAVGFGLRLWSAAETRLNGDEALHYELFHRAGAVRVYEASKTNAHPPLYFLSLWLWHLFGTSELWLRLPAVLFGSGAVWLLANWARIAFDPRAGVIVAILAATAPALVDVSSEVRGYGLLLFLLAGTLYWLERALQSGTPRHLLWFALFFVPATLTHYSVVWITAALGIYSLVVILRRRPPAAFVVSWIAVQCIVAAVYAFLWMTHLRHLHGGGMEKEAITTWLNRSYLGGGADAFDFVWANTVRLFLWLAVPVAPEPGQEAWGFVLAGLAVLGGAWCAWRRGLLPALLLVLPLVLACAAGLRDLFPYGGTRHSTFLAPFTIAALALPIVALAHWRSAAGLAAALALAAGWTAAARTEPLLAQRANETRESMARGIAFIRASVPAGGDILCDLQTISLMRYYLDRESLSELVGYPATTTGFIEQRIGGYRMLSPEIWSFKPTELEPTVLKLAAAYKLGRGTPVWIVDAGMERTLLLAFVDNQGRTFFPFAHVFDWFFSVFQARVP